MKTKYILEIFCTVTWCPVRRTGFEKIIYSSAAKQDAKNYFKCLFNLLILKLLYSSRKYRITNFNKNYPGANYYYFLK